ncbi:Pyruvate kinase [Candidatus Promineifilum breve]|uniref:Pyruvate kinase n=1 Tax=Candidatus Promineifilum breve TaxID=1806508 RepID=A0A160T3V9_9CHLR|nr:pyruvate kinase [Candidatus Promineifilum breve]CUS03728.2 Pyruvate kinase [Candidatus Promineifilum breve]
MARTKIVATIGPGSAHPETIRRMLAAGMTVARVNFSHGDHAAHTKTVAMLREVAKTEGKILAILGDLQGPKLRLGHVKAGGMMLAPGDEIVLTPRPGQPAMIHLPHPDLIAAAMPGNRLVIGDGEVEFTVAEKRSDTLRCLVTVGGLLESRKGVNAPGVDLPISCLSEKDLIDLELICELDFDYIALSFVRTVYDIQELRDIMESKKRQIPIIAKIEKSEAIDNLLAIRDAADGLMVARGDLGIEMPPQELPLLQKRIIAACNQVGKPVITATQMLQSMVEHPRPTRAEASDVANAILDGTDAVMLSGETATGKYPVESVMMMKQIAENIEHAFPYDQWRDRRTAALLTGSVTEAIGGASCSIAEEVDAAAIASATLSGYTAQQIARFRPRIPIVAVSPSAYTQRRLALVWGVETLLVPDFTATDTMLEETARALRNSGLEAGRRVVITAGVPFRKSGHTNLIKVHTI